MGLPIAVLREKLLGFLYEDVGMGDITTESIVPAGLMVEAYVVAKEPAVIAGVYEVKGLFELLDVKVVKHREDGEHVSKGEAFMELRGLARSILMAERTALNILMRMSGIATVTRRLVDKVRGAGFKAKIAATRKTAPGLRYFDKKAVAIGLGETHRFRLDDAVLIKDNHIAIAGGVEEAVKRARAKVSFMKKVEVEVKEPEEALKAARAGADVIMLDNMNPRDVEKAIEGLKAYGFKDKVLIEVSGNITEENILNYAVCGPDVISLGFITHSAKSIDISLEVVKVEG